MKPGDCDVLLVEDDPDIALLMRRALEKADGKCSVQVLGDGQQAIDYLKGRVGRPPSSLPHFVITDLKMPKASGFDVISWIRNEPRIATLPVVVLSSSGEQTDIDRAIGLGANSYIEKPFGLEDLVKIAKSLLASWANCERR